MKFLIGGSAIMTMLLNYSLVTVVVCVELAICAIFVYLIAATLMGKKDN